MKRSMVDAEWAEEVVRRWERRRWRVQQRDKAVSELREALEAAVVPWLRRINRVLDRAVKEAG